MPDQTSTIISKVWGMCNPLRDNGVSYGDYLEQLTYLIFLKMSDEYSKPPYRRETGIPFGYTWADMNTLKGAELEEQYKATLEKLGEQGGILGKIFKGAVNKISSAAILYRIVQMIDQERWVSMSSDVKGEIYEGLLQKNAEDVKSGAGQYFTPRPLIRAMVRCVRPEPMKTIADPCCGSGGFFLAAQEYIADEAHYTLDREKKEFLKNQTFYGNELVPSTFKLCLMNLYLHNIGDIYGNVPVTLGDALLTDPGYRVDYVLTNPPFGKKSSITFTNEEGAQEEEELETAEQIEETGEPGMDVEDLYEDGDYDYDYDDDGYDYDYGYDDEYYDDPSWVEAENEYQGELEARNWNLLQLILRFEDMGEYCSACQRFEELFKGAETESLRDFCQELEDIVNLYLAQRETAPLADTEKALDVYSRVCEGPLRQAKIYGRGLQWKDL